MTDTKALRATVEECRKYDREYTIKGEHIKIGEFNLVADHRRIVLSMLDALEAMAGEIAAYRWMGMSTVEPRPSEAELAHDILREHGITNDPRDDVPCPVCHGSGGEMPYICNECHGSGLDERGGIPTPEENDSQQKGEEQ